MPTAQPWSSDCEQSLQSSRGAEVDACASFCLSADNSPLQLLSRPVPMAQPWSSEGHEALWAPELCFLCWQGADMPRDHVGP